jgi:energy-converting hydrogenase Eha subunit G
MNQATNGHDHAEANHAAADEHDEAHDGGLNKTVATVVVVAAGAALFEAALLPGLVLGVAAMAAPKYLPKVAASLNPLFKSTVRGTYKLAQKSKEMFAEAHEQVHDIVAEVKAENDGVTGGASTPAA